MSWWLPKSKQKTKIKTKTHPLGNSIEDLGNKSFLKCSPTGETRKYMTFKPYSTYLSKFTEWAWSQIQDLRGKSLEVIVHLRPLYDSIPLLIRATHCIACCQLVRKPTYLHFYESCFIWQGSRDHSRVTEAGPQQCSHGEKEEHGSKHRDGRRQLDSQVTASGESKQLNI